MANFLLGCPAAPEGKQWTTGCCLLPRSPLESLGVAKCPYRKAQVAKLCEVSVAVPVTRVASGHLGQMHMMRQAEVAPCHACRHQIKHDTNNHIEKN